MARTAMCIDCAAWVTAKGIHGRLPERCRTCRLKLGSKRQSEIYWRTHTPITSGVCIDCGSTYETSRYATTRVRCEPCRTTYAAISRQAYADAHPEVTHRAKRKWLEANRDFMRVTKHNRRVAERASKERFSRAEIYERDDWICHICGLAVDRNLTFPDPGSPSMDHVIPLSAGGDHTRANVKLAHLHCNQSKGGVR